MQAKHGLRKYQVGFQSTGMPARSFSKKIHLAGRGRCAVFDLNAMSGLDIEATRSRTVERFLNAAKATIIPPAERARVTPDPSPSAGPPPPLPP